MKVRSTKEVLFRALSLYGGYKKDVFIIFFGSVIGAVTSLIYPYISKYILEEVLYMDTIRAIPILMFAAVAYLILMFGDIFYTKITNYNTSELYVNIISDIKEELYKKLHKLSFSWYDNIHSGKIVTVLDGDTDASSHLVSDIAPTLVSSILQLIGGIIVFFTISPMMMCFILPLVIILAFFNIWIIPKMRTQLGSIRSVVAEQNEVAEDAVGGIRTTQAYGMEEKEIDKFTAYNYKLQNLIKHKWKLIFIHNAVSDSLSSICYAAFMIVGAYLVINKKISMSDIALFYMYFHIVTNPMYQIRSHVKEISKCIASYERVLDIMDAAEEVHDSANALEIKIKGDIVFDNVSFSYNNYTNLIQGMFLHIGKGEHVAIVGESGSGKSTLVGLIPRFYNINSGYIFIDGTCHTLIDLHTLRRSIGYISQEPFLYNISILENIRYGCQEATREQVIDAAKKAGAHKFILKLAEGYESKVGERGVKLSGGQKQRIAIARLFLLNPPIMIFDEATSALDSVQEKKVQKALNELAKGKTCITIAHRLSTIKDADRILVMDDGKIVESGTHNQLIVNPNGVYHRLYTTQYGKAGGKV